MTAALLVLLISRPLWLTVRQDPNDPGARYVAGMQARQGLPIDGGRTYAEETVTWLSWWLGPMTLTLAAAALVVAVHGLARRWGAGERLPSWSAPLLIATASTLMTLWRPGITPDHPWAERRLVIAIPLACLLAIAAIARLRVPPRARLHGVGSGGTPRLRGAALLVTVAGIAVVLPTALATRPLAAARVEAGELVAVQRVCASLAQEDVVLMVDARAANEWPQVIRGQCGRPALSTTSALRKDPVGLAATIDRVRAAVESSGGRIVLLAADDQPPASFAGSPWVTAIDTTVMESQHVLERRPDRLDALRLVVRIARP